MATGSRSISLLLWLGALLPLAAAAQFSIPIPAGADGAGGLAGGGGAGAGALTSIGSSAGGGGGTRSLVSPSINNGGRAVPRGGRPATDRLGEPRGQSGMEIAAPVVELRERLEFQDFISQSTGRELPVFGADLFKNVSSTYAPVDTLPPTDDYVIGPGDEIQIRGWGQVDIDWASEVNRNGRISIPQIGAVSVVGIKFKDLQPHLKAAIGKVFRNFDLTVSLGQLRSIQVFVVGQVKRPGSFTVNSMSTLINAVFAAGGPSVKGSLRGIQLKRGNTVVTELDLYDFLIKGDKSRDAPLMPGDVIYVPPVGSLVAITGSVNVPAIYELKKESSLADLIAWSGGLSSTAMGQKVTLERIENRSTRKVDEYTLGQSAPMVRLRDGDLVTVYSVTPRIENAVTLRGNVAQPARFPWRQGMRVKDIIPQTEALLSREFWLRRNQSAGLDSEIAELVRRNRAAGVEISVTDLLRRNQLPEAEAASMSLAESMRRTQISADAATANSTALKTLNPPPQPVVPGQPPAAPAPAPRAPTGGPELAPLFGQAVPGPLVEKPGGKLADDIKRNTGEVNWEYALIERFNPKDLTTTLVPFNLGKAILEGDTTHNLLLQPGDVVTVFSVDDIQVPVAKQTKYVRLEGEFSSPGLYAVQPGETLRQLVARVGGITPNAYLFGSEFTRESTRVSQQKKLAEMINRLERDLQSNAISRSKNLVSVEEAAGLGQEAQAQVALVARLRQIRATGRIVLELPPEESARLRDLPDIALEDGDRFIVPPRPSTVSVVGAVYNENAFVFKSDKRLTDYLQQAGGVSRFGDKNDVYVIRPDGTVLSKRQTSYFGSFDTAQLLPGDTVVVPEEVDRVTWTKVLKDYGQILYQFGLGAAALRVLRN